MGTLAARAAAAAAMGLISTREYRELHTIKQIRNQFAHHHRTSFSDRSIADRCRNLTFSAKDYGDVVVGARGQFTTAALALILNLTNRSHYVNPLGKRSTPHMSNDTVVSLGAPARVSDPLTELLRTGAPRLIEAAVSAEFEEYLSAFVQEQLPDGRQRVVRNGHLPERKILTGLGEVDVRVPKSRSRSGSPSLYPLNAPRVRLLPGAS